jgi:hypothetical protein
MLVARAQPCASAPPCALHREGARTGSAHAGRARRKARGWLGLRRAATPGHRPRSSKRRPNSRIERAARHRCRPASRVACSCTPPPWTSARRGGLAERRRRSRQVQPPPASRSPRAAMPLYGERLAASVPTDGEAAACPMRRTASPAPRAPRPGPPIAPDVRELPHALQSSIQRHGRPTLLTCRRAFCRPWRTPRPLPRAFAFACSTGLRAQTGPSTGSTPTSPPCRSLKAW